MEISISSVFIMFTTINMTLPVFYFPNQDLSGRGGGGGGGGECNYFLLIKRHGMSKIMYDVGGGR